MYKYVYNQKIHNQNTLLNYIVGYLYFIKISESINNSNNIWAKQHMDHN